jgi:hypothetical protein
MSINEASIALLLLKLYVMPSVFLHNVHVLKSPDVTPYVLVVPNSLEFSKLKIQSVETDFLKTFTEKI